MSYVKTNLVKNEEIIKLTKPSIKIMFVPLLWLVLGFALAMSYSYKIGSTLFFLALLQAIPRYLAIYTTELALTNQRIIAKYGLIRRNTFEIKLDKIESINLDQSIFARLLNYGYVAVNGSGGNTCDIPFIDDPLSFRKLCNEEIDKYTTSK